MRKQEPGQQLGPLDAPALERAFYLWSQLRLAFIHFSADWPIYAGHQAAGWRRLAGALDRNDAPGSGCRLITPTHAQGVRALERSSDLTPWPVPFKPGRQLNAAAQLP